MIFIISFLFVCSVVSTGCYVEKDGIVFINKPCVICQSDSYFDNTIDHLYIFNDTVIKRKLNVIEIVVFGNAKLTIDYYGIGVHSLTLKIDSKLLLNYSLNIHRALTSEYLSNEKLLSFLENNIIAVGKLHSQRFEIFRLLNYQDYGLMYSREKDLDKNKIEIEIENSDKISFDALYSMRKNCNFDNCHNDYNYYDILYNLSEANSQSHSVEQSCQCYNRIFSERTGYYAYIINEPCDLSENNFYFNLDEIDSEKIHVFNNANISIGIDIHELYIYEGSVVYFKNPNTYVRRLYVHTGSTIFLMNNLQIGGLNIYYENNEQILNLLNNRIVPIGNYSILYGGAISFYKLISNSTSQETFLTEDDISEFPILQTYYNEYYNPGDPLSLQFSDCSMIPEEICAVTIDAVVRANELNISEIKPCKSVESFDSSELLDSSESSMLSDSSELTESSEYSEESSVELEESSQHSDIYESSESSQNSQSTHSQSESIHSQSQSYSQSQPQSSQPQSSQPPEPEPEPEPEPWLLHPICISPTDCLEYDDNDPINYKRGYYGNKPAFQASRNGLKEWFRVSSGKINPIQGSFNGDVPDLFLKNIPGLGIDENTRYKPIDKCFYVGYVTGSIEKLCNDHYLKISSKCFIHKPVAMIPKYDRTYCVGQNFNLNRLSFVGNSPY